MTIQITIPSCPIVKKNNEHISYWKTDKYGRKTPREFPIKYPTPAYKEWSKQAIKACADYKNTHTEIDFPLQGQYNLKCIFYMDRNTVVDLSNLYEGTQDVLAGSVGIWEKTVPKHLYQIIEDDSVRFIGSHDGSRVVLDYVKPRTEITLTEFKW